NAIVKGEENIYSNLINEAEKIIIEQALKQTKNRKIDAAKILGIGRNTITRKIKELLEKKA
ncbi:MAG: helix-turn-helix domain-containing protein, partial [Methylophilaceae bacterium]